MVAIAASAATACAASAVCLGALRVESLVYTAKLIYNEFSSPDRSDDTDNTNRGTSSKKEAGGGGTGNIDPDDDWKQNKDDKKPVDDRPRF